MKMTIPFKKEIQEPMTPEKALARLKAMRIESDREHHELLDYLISLVEHEIPEDAVQEGRIEKCPACGKELGSGWRCLNCGQKVK